jgi:nucleoid DNA-binding protein
MLELLRRYLYLHKSISLNGFGTLLLEEIPARIDYPNKLLHPLQYKLQFQSTSNSDDHFSLWVSEQLNISREESAKQTAHFISDLKQRLINQNIVEWEGIGVFKNDENQVLRFTPTINIVTGDPVAAEKIIRKNAEHFIRVGEQEKTNTQMQELLFGTKKKVRFHWWYSAVILLVLGIAAILYFASLFPTSWKMQGNKTELKTNQAPKQYQIQ